MDPEGDVLFEMNETSLEFYAKAIIVDEESLEYLDECSMRFESIGQGPDESLFITLRPSEYNLMLERAEKYGKFPEPGKDVIDMI